eukprot:TRINITY_DN10914_c0_g1_i1.p2 TRINITY_DN10914_c0_g1~~TRINITY_DN10914_c0_g1_i1.p2  ORF type:complete len:390 (-),score=84.90 TRINITY_DN10914_c0_g1_i1:1815-2984(-)
MARRRLIIAFVVVAVLVLAVIHASFQNTASIDHVSMDSPPVSDVEPVRGSPVLTPKKATPASPAHPAVPERPSTSTRPKPKPPASETTKPPADYSGMHRTKTTPPFWFWHNQFEMYNTVLMYRLLRNRCGVVDGVPTGLTLDVGAERGWFTAFYNELGCRVKSVEASIGKMDAQFRRANNLDHVEFIEGGVSDTTAPIVVDAMDAGTLTLNGIPLDTIVDDHVYLMKIDIEGCEILALRGVMRAIKNGFLVDDIIVEFTPKWWKNFDVSIENGIALLQEFLQDYDMYGVYWSTRSRFESNGAHTDGFDFANGRTVDNDDMTHVQRVPAADAEKYVRAIRVQRDIWLHRRTVSLEGTGLQSRVNASYVCPSPDEWAPDASGVCGMYVRPT